MQSKGFYLYAIRPAFAKPACRRGRATAGKPAVYSDIFPEIKGVDQGSSAFPLLIGDRIEAIVSLVPIEQFSQEEVFEKAQNDLSWIKEKSAFHNQVIMQSAEGSDGATVPMKFGSIFRDKKSLQDAIKKDYEKFLALFKKLKGREEWAVKAYVEHEALKKEIIKSDVELRNKEAKLSSLALGVSYFKEKELEQEIETRKRAELQRWTREIFGKLSKFASASTQGKILGKELTMKREPMILNTIFLVDKKKIRKFLKEVEILHGSMMDKGLMVQVSGPWPPYNFV